MSFSKPRSSPSLLVLLVVGDGCRSCRYSEERKKREEDKDMTPSLKNDDGLIYSNRKPFSLVMHSIKKVTLLGRFRSVKIILRPVIGRRHCETTSAFV